MAIFLGYVYYKSNCIYCELHRFLCSQDNAINNVWDRLGSVFRIQSRKAVRYNNIYVTISLILISWESHELVLWPVTIDSYNQWKSEPDFLLFSVVWHRNIAIMTSLSTKTAQGAHKMYFLHSYRVKYISIDLSDYYMWLVTLGSANVSNTGLGSVCILFIEVGCWCS